MILSFWQLCALIVLSAICVNITVTQIAGSVVYTYRKIKEIDLAIQEREAVK